MASTKALAAIALTMIIVVPIGLGYLMALEEVDVTGWETTDSVNISDLMLNGSTAYYDTYNTPSNNSQIMQKINAMGQTEVRTTSPAYNDVSGTYSSVPVYEYTNTYYDLSDVDYMEYPFNVGPVGKSVGTLNSGANYHVEYSDYYWIGLHPNSNPIHYQFLLGNSGFVYNLGTHIELMRNSDNTWKVISTDESMNGLTVSSWAVFTDSTSIGGEVQVAQRNYATVSASADGTFMLPAFSGIRLEGNPTVYLPITSAVEVVKTGSNVTVGVSNYANVSRIDVVMSAEYDEVVYTTKTATGQYANISAGWKVPTTTNAYNYWINGQTNQSVTMVVSMAKDSWVYLSTVSVADGSETEQVYLHKDGNFIYLNTKKVGAYPYVLVEITKTGYTASGLNSLPQYAETPTKYNTVSYDVEIPAFNAVKMSPSTNGSPAKEIWFRVDGAQALAGYFPSTIDYTLNMAGLFPEQSYTVVFNSIGVYGDSLTIGGQSFTVTDGKITINGVAIPLKGAMISSWEMEPGTYTTTINGVAIGTASTSANIGFGGEWSLTAMKYTVQELTHKELQWQAGQFGLDKSGMCAAALLVAGIMFVALGISGRRSGIKIGLLLLVCGGAVATYLIMI